jgi:hypothetical protein
MDMTVDGLGDISVLARQRFCLDDRRRRHRDAGDDGGFDLSLIGGLELPTGQTGAAGNGVRNPVEVQAGSGSFDPFLGGLARLDLGRSRLQALVLYKFNTEGAQQHQAGDAFVGSFSGRVPLVGEEYRGPAVEANLGLQYKHRGRAEQFDTPLASSGADELFVQIGLGARPRPHLDVALSLDLPIYSHYDGTQLARDYQINFRFGIRF